MITIWTKRAAAVLIVTVALVAGLVQDVRAQTTSVSIQNYTFAPETLTVAAGTTVQWTNLDSVAHTVTSDSNAFGSGVLAHQGQFTFKFTQPGTYTYHCQIHDYMTGSIVVTSAGGPATSTPTTVPTVTPPPATTTATATGVSNPPTATATAPAATSTTVPSATDTPVPPTATATTVSASPGVLRVAMSGNLRAGHKGTLTVSVVNAKSHPVKGVQLSANLTRVGVSASKSAKTDSHGKARLSFTPRKQGAVTIRASKHGYRTKTVTARVHA